jgi:exopolyphosphatase/guanosine-5'-triphosphate,3'-diphosphate pyrophosphatase
VEGGSGGYEGLVAVLDMGASAIRLVVAEVRDKQTVQVLSEASRGVLLGRDSFSGGILRPQTWDAAFTALEGFREIIDSHGVKDIRAVATSAVREARNGEAFLDRIRRDTGISFEIINEAEESRLIYLAVRHALGKHPVLEGAWTLVVEVGGGSTSLTLLERGQPSRSGVYALGAVRLRQQLDLRRHRHDIQVALLRRWIANVVEQIGLEIPLRRVTQMVAVGGDIRLAAGEIEQSRGQDGIREVPREALLAFSDEVERLDSDGLVSRFRLPAVEAETLVPALLIYRTLLSETTARRVVVSDASLRAGVLLDLLDEGGSQEAGDFERQVLASAEAVGQRFQFDREHGRHVAMLATELFDQLRDEHGLTDRDRLLLQTASLLHDVGIYVSLRAHHKHSQYLLAASQIFGLSDEETKVVSNIARYHRRGTPRRSHLPYMELDQADRLLVNKLAALLRIANALDAEHLQKVRDVRLVRAERTWVLELDGTGDITMEQMAAVARADMFTEVYGRDVIVRVTGVSA